MSARRVRERPLSFWAHQLAEYGIGVVVAAQAVRARQEALPLVVVPGLLVLLNVAVSGPPLGAMGAVSRKVHRVLDLAVIVVFVLAAPAFHGRADIVAWVAGEAGAVLLAFIWLQTDFRPRPVRVRRARAERPAAAATRGGGTSSGESAARAAGRAAGALGRHGPRALGRVVGQRKRDRGGDGR